MYYGKGRIELPSSLPWGRGPRLIQYVSWVFMSTSPTGCWVVRLAVFCTACPSERVLTDVMVMEVIDRNARGTHVFHEVCSQLVSNPTRPPPTRP